jgi:hypothetical protein
VRWIDHYDVFIHSRQHGEIHTWRNGDKALVVAEYGDWEFYAVNAGLDQASARACSTPSISYQDASLRPQPRATCQDRPAPCGPANTSIRCNASGKTTAKHLAEVPLVHEQSDERLRGCAEQLAALEKTLRGLVAEDRHASERIERLQSVRGAGKITAWTVWADLPEIGTLSPWATRRLRRLAPTPADSALYQGVRRISHDPAPPWRRVLSRAAVTARQPNPQSRLPTTPPKR